MTEPATPAASAPEANPATNPPAPLAPTFQPPQAQPAQAPSARQPAQPQQPAPEAGDEEPFDKGRALEKIRKANSEAENLRKKLAELQPLAELGKAAEDARKTDMQRLEEARAAAETERDSLRVQVARMTAAARHGLSADLADLLGTGTAEDIDARAALLASKLVAATQPDPPAQPPTGNGTSRPVEALRPAGQPGTDSDRGDPNSWLRALARR